MDVLVNRFIRDVPPPPDFEGLKAPRVNFFVQFGAGLIEFLYRTVDRVCCVRHDGFPFVIVNTNKGTQ